jgi:RNA polymerase sigma factor for flagellar operon FliA
VWSRFLGKKDPRARERAREELARAYYGLVESESRRLLGRLPIKAYRQKKEDLVSAGVVGLLQALDHFSPPRGKVDDPGRAFEAYARYRIRGQMIDELRSLDFARRNLRKQARLIRETEERLQTELGRLPREEEVADAIGVPLAEFYDWVAEINMLNLLSLDAGHLSPKEGTTPWAEVLADPRADDPLQQAERKEKTEWLSNSLRKLPEAEQRVLYLYYLENLTFREIGKVLRLSESRVCQVHHMALFRLQGMTEGREKAHGRLHDNLHATRRRLSDGFSSDRER